MGRPRTELQILLQRGFGRHSGTQYGAGTLRCSKLWKDPCFSFSYLPGSTAGFLFAAEACKSCVLQAAWARGTRAPSSVFRSGHCCTWFQGDVAFSKFYKLMNTSGAKQQANKVRFSISTKRQSQSNLLCECAAQIVTRMSVLIHYYKMYVVAKYFWQCWLLRICLSLNGRNI